MIATAPTTGNINGGGADGAGQRNGGGGGGLKKGPWSAGEDAVLIDYVKKHGEGNWNAVQRNTGLQRCGKSCRLRWANHLRPNLKKGAFSADEERLIIELHSKLGNKWARISNHLPGRTDNEIKNYWNTRVKRRLRQGLPLYPNDASIQPPPPPPPQQPPMLPLSLHKPPPTTNTATTLPLFDPVSIFALHHPSPMLSSHHLIKRPNPFMGRPVSQLGQFQQPNHLMGFGFGSGLTRFESGDLGLGLDRCGSSDFNGLNNSYELPSNQLCQKMSDEDNPGENVKMSGNMGRTKSGLLDDLLQEAQAKVGGGDCLKNGKEDCGGLQWDISSCSENSSTGIKKEVEEQPLNSSMNEDLSNILELIPSLVHAPAWCDDNGGRESSAGHSSVISADDNYNGHDDQRPQIPSFPTTVSTADYDDDDGNWNPSCYSWDNLPRIC